MNTTHDLLRAAVRDHALLEREIVAEAMRDGIPEEAARRMLARLLAGGNATLAIAAAICMVVASNVRATRH